MKPFSLGYIGVGLMGGPMVKRLASLGWSVKGYDIVPQRSTTQSPAEAARGTDVVLLNLPTNDAVKDAMFRADGVASAVTGKQLVVDFSTIPVDECRSHAERLLEQTGCRWVDAPVSGGPPAVEAGSLTVMAGGEEKDIARLQPLMKDIAGRCTRMRIACLLNGVKQTAFALPSAAMSMVKQARPFWSKTSLLVRRSSFQPSTPPQCITTGGRFIPFGTCK